MQISINSDEKKLFIWQGISILLVLLLYGITLYFCNEIVVITGSVFLTAIVVLLAAIIATSTAFRRAAFFSKNSLKI